MELRKKVSFDFESLAVRQASQLGKIFVPKRIKILKVCEVEKEFSVENRKKEKKKICETWCI